MHDLQHEASAIRATIRQLAYGDGDPAPALAELGRQVALFAELEQTVRALVVELLDELGDGPDTAA